MEITVSSIASLYAQPYSKEQSHSKSSYRGQIKNVAFALAQESNARRKRVQQKLGLSREKEGIDMYERVTGHAVNFRNSRSLVLYVGNVKIVGKVDGITDNDVLVEHKRRTRGLFRKVLLHERIQCNIYMKMLGIEHAHLVETFGEHMMIHSIRFDQELWDSICRKLAQKFS